MTNQKHHAILVLRYEHVFTSFHQLKTRKEGGREICRLFFLKFFTNVFEYSDRYSNGKWNQQECVVSSMKECKRIYGLDDDPDCKYRIISAEHID